MALGVLYLDAARQCDLPVQGVDFPGHFLLRIETREGPLALDPFSEGRVVLPSELIRRALRTGLTPDVAAAREGQGALVGAQEALARAQMIDGGASIAARAARERVRMKLN